MGNEQALDQLREGVVPGSFRDPSGFVYYQGGVLLRQVNGSYQGCYDRLMKTGLYQDLVEAGLLIPHTEVSVDLARTPEAYKVVQPKTVPFLSYPYEWCFSQLRDAALITLEIHRRALDRGMFLKDASAYNIQFVDGKPVLIDSLSFEIYQEGAPWIAYRQFCQHFLAPLALMSYRDVRLGQLLRVHIDGIPLDLAAALLPFRSCLNLGVLLHIHLHARGQTRFADVGVSRETMGGHVSLQALRALIDNLLSTIRGLQWDPKGTAWSDYYEGDSYDEGSITHKKELVEGFIEQINPRLVWDIGANVGLFSRIAASRGILTISLDSDPGCVELNYRRMVGGGETNLLPLMVDLTNPSPALGWENRERMSWLERGPADALLALALVHHLVISNNVPLDRLAHFLAELCNWLIIEFVPKSDPKVQKLLAMRDDIFPNYTQAGFEAEFKRPFALRCSEQINQSGRVLYLMERQ